MEKTEIDKLDEKIKQLQEKKNKYKQEIPLNNEKKRPERKY